MKKILLIGLFLTIMSSTPQLYAEGNFVTSKKLTISDVEKFIQQTAGKDKKVLKIFGIHQQGSQATIFFKTQYRDRPTRDIVRLNSGKWFYPGGSKFLMK